MKKNRLVGMLTIGMLSLVSVFALNAAENTGLTTQNNIQAAFNGETNAHAKYTAYAAKADAEGYKSVAALFYASAKSESIHAAAYGKMLKAAGIEPKAPMNKIVVKSTRENLEEAIKGENYETKTLYPDFVKQAQIDKNDHAAMIFKGAGITEKEHSRLYQLALKELPSWKAAGKEFLVCTVCGYTTMDMGTKKCVVCAAPRSKFLSVK